MISIVITAFNEPRTISRAIEAIINQKIPEKYELTIACPDKETTDIVKQYSKKYKQIKHFKDPGKGKSLAINLLLKKLKGRILIFTDGDIFLYKNAIKEIHEFFKDETVGVVGGRLAPTDDKENMYGYWAHLLADAGAHKIRQELSDKNKYLEISAQLMAFRNNIIKEIPFHVAEDAIIPYLFWKKGYKIKYAPKAKVYFKNPGNFQDWLKQRLRTAKAHEGLKGYKDLPRVKSFWNEAGFGTVQAMIYPKNFKEVTWTALLFLARLYLWFSVFYDVKFKQKTYVDGWERIETAR